MQAQVYVACYRNPNVAYQSRRKCFWQISHHPRVKEGEMAKTGFVHCIDGFAFGNNWQMLPGDWDQLKGIIAGAASAIGFLPIMQPVMALVPPGPPFSEFEVGAIVTNQIVSNANPGIIGLCGGMAYAAADYYRMSWLPSRGEFATGGPRNPGWTSGAESTLRRYIWSRLLDSLQGGGVAQNTLLWMGVAHGIWPFSLLGGAQWLRDRSREQFQNIKAVINSGQVCPIALIGTTSNPLDNHQVLVTGYDDPGTLGPNSCCLYVFEPNHPNWECTIDFDFTGAQPPQETASSSLRGPLQGFFASNYALSTPPAACVVTAGLSASLSPTVNVGQTEQFTMSVRNLGWGDTPPLKLYVAGRAGGGNVDAGAEPTAARILMGASRTITQPAIIGAPAGQRYYFASSSVETFAPSATPGGTGPFCQAWRLPTAGGGVTSINLTVSEPAPSWASRGGILTTPPSVISTSDGRLSVFATGTDGNPWTISQTAPSNGWGGWARATSAPLAVGMPGRPKLLRDSNGQINLFGTGGDRSVWHIWQAGANGPFGNWEGFACATPTDPSVNWNLDGRCEIFIHQNDNTAAHRWYTPAGWMPPFNNWDSRGGNLLGGPTLARNADGRLEVFARFADNIARHIWQTSPGGGWSDWEQFGNNVTSEIAVGVNGDGRLEVFCVAGGVVWHRWQTAPSNGWSDWNNTGCAAAADALPAVVTNSFGFLEVCVRGPDAAIWTTGCRGAPTWWTPWISLGGSPNGDPALGINADGRCEVFVRGTDGTLQHRWQLSPGNWT
jgi:hypothetical protein